MSPGGGAGSNSKNPKMQSWPHPSTKHCKHSPSPQIKNATMAPCSMPKCNHGPLIRKELRWVSFFDFFYSNICLFKGDYEPYTSNAIHLSPCMYVHRILGVVWAIIKKEVRGYDPRENILIIEM